MSEVQVYDTFLGKGLCSNCTEDVGPCEGPPCANARDVHAACGAQRAALERLVELWGSLAGRRYAGPVLGAESWQQAWRAAEQALKNNHD